MLTQAILVGLVGAFGGLDYQLGTLYAFRPIVLCPLVGLVLGGPADWSCRWRQPGAAVHGFGFHRRLRAA